MIRLATKEREFSAPPAETIEKIPFGILWSNDRKGRENKIISPFQWSLITPYSPHFGYGLRDHTGEWREIRYRAYHRAIEFQSWSEYDQDELKKRLKEAQSKIQQLRLLINGEEERINSLIHTLEEVYEINERAGPGSRKKVRKLLSEKIIICDECGMATCHDSACCDN